jgi:hypothetical protein
MAMSPGLTNKRERLLVGLPVTPAVERMAKHIIRIVRGQREEGHAGPEFDIVGRVENRMQGRTFGFQHDPGALIEPWPEHRMRQIGARFVQGADAVKPGRRHQRADHLLLWYGSARIDRPNAPACGFL